MTTHTAAIAGLVLALGLTGSTSGATTGAAPSSPRCAGLPQGSEPAHLDPGDFTTRIDHPYWPMRPGSVWRYVERGGGETAKVVVRVTDRTKVIEGVRARIVRDTVTVDGELAEDTWDWFAQDSDGNLWYLGEYTREYDDGMFVSTEGSWKHGRDGAFAGVILPAVPKAGCGYREEYLEGEAEDRARILSTREKLRTPTGFHRRVVQTANTTPLEPDLLENKFYARGIGPVLELDLSPALGRNVLVRFKQR